MSLNKDEEIKCFMFGFHLVAASRGMSVLCLKIHAWMMEKDTVETIQVILYTYKNPISNEFFFSLSFSTSFSSSSCVVSVCMQRYTG